MLNLDLHRLWREHCRQTPDARLPQVGVDGPDAAVWEFPLRLESLVAPRVLGHWSRFGGKTLGRLLAEDLAQCGDIICPHVHQCATGKIVVETDVIGLEEAGEYAQARVDLRDVGR